MITWDDTGSRKFETGVERGVFYPKTGSGVAWNGLVSINESVDSSTQSVIYMDGVKQVNRIDIGSFIATLEAFTYPDEFIPYDGVTLDLTTGQKRLQFDISYRTLIGNDINGIDLGYRLHLVYNCMAKPTSRDNNSINSDTDIQNFSWDLSSVPVALPYDQPTSHIYLQTDTVDPVTLTTIENILYGTDVTESRMPSMDEVLSIFEANAIFIVVDNGDHTFTVTGPDDWVTQDLIDSTIWALTSPSVIPITTDTYKVSSY